MRTSTRLTSFAALLCATSTARATDWIVDDSGGPGVQFTTIQAAIDAAQTGDHVLVRDGTYAGFVIDGKGLVVATDAGASAAITGQVRIQNTPVGTGTQVLGFVVDLSTTPAGQPLAISSNAGAVVVSRCILRGFDGSVPAVAVSIGGSANVLLHGCEVAGGDAGFTNSFSRGANGLEVAGSHVELHDCTLTGGRGGSDFTGAADDDLYSGQPGGSAMSLSNSSGSAERSSFTGGRGGDSSSDFLETRWPGVGGPGVFLGTSSFEHYLSTFTGGPAGIDQGFGSGTASAGLPIHPPNVATQPGRTAICFGLYDRCPCGNESDGANGCDNSFGNGGSRLEVTGNASLGNDTMTLTVSKIGPSASALFFQGTSLVSVGLGSAFGDGLRCAGGSIVRLGSRVASGGVATLGFAMGDGPISVTGHVAAPGATRVYQVWYRNSAVFCTASSFNFTNGFEVRWDN